MRKDLYWMMFVIVLFGFFYWQNTQHPGHCYSETGALIR
jgi:hypothetical protein